MGTCRCTPCALVPRVHAGAELHFRHSALHSSFGTSAAVHVKLYVWACTVQLALCVIVLPCDDTTSVAKNQRHLFDG